MGNVDTGGEQTVGNGSNNTLSPTELPRPQSALQRMCHMITSVPNSNLEARRRLSLQSQLMEHQATFATAAKNIHRILVTGTHETDLGTKDPIPDTPGSIADYLTQRNKQFSRIDLKTTMENEQAPNARLAETLNASLIQAFQMLPDGVSVEQLPQYLSGLQRIMCHDQATFDKLAAQAEQDHKIVALTRVVNGKPIFTAFRGFTNPNLGIAAGYTAGLSDVGVMFSRNVLTEVARNALTT